jgi:hypothetical protein
LGDGGGWGVYFAAGGFDDDGFAVICGFHGKAGKVRL